jgi:hypothetical protein
VLWLALLAGPILTIEVPVGAGRVLSVSAFDAIVLTAFIVLCRPYRPSALRCAAAGLWPVALFGALAAGHSAAFLAFGHDLQLPGLLRETVKYVGFAANIAMLVVIFRTDPMDRAPPAGALVLAAVVIGLVSMAYTWTPIFYIGGSYVTVIGAVLTTTAFLLTALPDGGDRRGTILTVTALAAALAGLSSIWSKIFLLFTAGCAALFVARAGARRLGVRVGRQWGLAVMSIITVLLLTALLYMSQEWRFDSSASIRLALWSIAADLASRSFPWGIGLGQFGAWLADLAQYKGDGQLRFVHNQFLAFVTEAGAVGIALGLIVVKLVIDAMSAWRGVMGAIFVCILLGALTLHDGIGLRAMQLLLGYSFAVAVRPGVGGSERRSFP